MGDERRAGLDFARDPGTGDVALNLAGPFALQVINGSGWRGTKEVDPWILRNGDRLDL
jgi:hypothetical protein